MKQSTSVAIIMQFMKTPDINFYIASNLKSSMDTIPYIKQNRCTNLNFYLLY